MNATTSIFIIICLSFIISMIAITAHAQVPQLNAQQSPYLTVPQFEEDVEVLRAMFLKTAETEGATVLEDEDFDFWIHEHVYHVYRSRGVTIMGEPEFLNRE